MSGNSGRVRVILQPRDEKLFSALSVLRVVDREQAALVMGVLAIRRANARLLKLVRAGFLTRSFVGSAGCGRRALYQLRADRSRVSPAFLQHQLILNQVYLALHASTKITVRSWQRFSRPLADGIPLIPDAYAELTGEGVFQPLYIEVDRGTESSRVWREKAQRYQLLAFSGEFARITGKARFRVAVLTTSSRRLAHIRRAVLGVTEKLFWFSTFDILNGNAVFEPVWLRPSGSGMVALL